jgi:hypothetical protein
MSGLDLTGKDFLTVKEAARYLRISTFTMYRLCRVPPDKGGPPVHRLRIPGKRVPRRVCSPIRIPTQNFISWATQGDTKRA